MGLAIIDPHSHKVRAKLYKIPKFGVNRPNSKQDTANDLKISKFTMICMAIRMLSDKVSRWPYISLLILTFLNCCISVKTSLINTKLGDFVNLGMLFLTMWINSCLSHNLQTRSSMLNPFPVKSVADRPRELTFDA